MGRSQEKAGAETVERQGIDVETGCTWDEIAAAEAWWQLQEQQEQEWQTKAPE